MLTWPLSQRFRSACQVRGWAVSLGGHFHLEWVGTAGDTSSAGVGVGSCAQLLEGGVAAYNGGVPKPLRAPWLHPHPWQAALSHTTLPFVHPFPDSGFPSPLCPLGRLMVGSGTSQPGVPSVTSSPSSQLPPASGEYGPSEISQAMKEKDRCGTQTAGRASQGRACSGEPCRVAALAKGLCLVSPCDYSDG